ncbi:MAG TPA: NHLP bacteriocin system secretion protein [Longimicrobium sp.]|nr:NHLP bacteriocin system secretion protein [Longimicrobium sp.]
MRESVFRKVSLDRLASPEQLDQMMQATTPRGWIALSALGLLLLTVVGWGFAGAVPEKLGGEGILIKTGGVFEVVPLEGGRVTDVAVRVGEVVNEGQVVARVAQPEKAAALREARAKLEDLRLERRRIQGAGGSELGLQAEYLAQQRANLEATIRAAQENQRFLTQKIEAQEQLARDGLITRQTLAATRQELQTAQEAVRAAQGQLKQLTVDQLAARQRVSSEVQASGFRVEEAEREVRRLEEDLERASAVVSPYTGRVLEVMTEQGHVVTRGEPVLRVDPVGRAVKDLEAVVYVPSDAGKKIRPGMLIHIAPSTVREEEFGYMLGTVTYVSDFPASPDGMARVLKNERLVSALAGDGQAPYEVHADLVPDPRTVSRYRWSSPAGPPMEIRSGTLARAQVTVNRVRPVELVLPLVRRLSGK